MKRIIVIAIVLLSGAGVSRAQERFVAYMTGAQVVPAVATSAKATCSFTVNQAQLFVTVTCTFSGLSSNATGAVTGSAAVGATGPALFNYPSVPAATSGTIGPTSFKYTLQQILDMRAHKHYASIRSVNFPGGELRGQMKQVNTVWDNDGDGRTDPVVFRQTGNRFWTLNSLTGASFTTSIGSGSGDIFMNNTGDFDGDGRADSLLLKTQGFQNSVTWLIQQTNTSTLREVWWGSFAAPALDVAVPADYDGDGKLDIAMFRRSTGVWWDVKSSTNGPDSIQFGSPNDLPAIGDYDGDGKADPTVVRPSNGQLIWYTLRTSDGQVSVTPWGAAATDSVAAFAPLDIDGDGKQDICVVRSVGGQRQFIVLQSSNSQIVYVNWGLTTDTALYGDYDGDGKTDFVARRNQGGQLAWYILRSSDQQMQFLYWGLSTDQ